MENENYDYKQIHAETDGSFLVKGYKSDGYSASSVCAGMTRIDFLDCYDSVEDAAKAHPEILDKDGEPCWGSAFMDRDLKDVSHIPDEPDAEMPEIHRNHEEPSFDPYDHLDY